MDCRGEDIYHVVDRMDEVAHTEAVSFWCGHLLPEKGDASVAQDDVVGLSMCLEGLAEKTDVEVRVAQELFGFMTESEGFVGSAFHMPSMEEMLPTDERNQFMHRITVNHTPVRIHVRHQSQYHLRRLSLR